MRISDWSSDVCSSDLAIERANASTIEDLSRNVAGLTVQNLGPGQSQVAIRGVSAGQIIRDQPGVKEQVGVYLDESVISLSLFTPDLDLFDLNRVRSEEHTSELQSLMRISYAVFCLKKKQKYIRYNIRQ